MIKRRILAVHIKGRANIGHITDLYEDHSVEYRAEEDRRDSHAHHLGKTSTLLQITVSIKGKRERCPLLANVKTNVDISSFYYGDTIVKGTWNQHPKWKSKNER